MKVRPSDLALAKRAGAWITRHAAFWSRWGGPLLTAVILVVLEVVSRKVVRIPDPFAILFLATVFAAFGGGLRAGLISATLTWLYLGYISSSTSSQLFPFTDQALGRVIVWALVLPVTVMIIALMKRRAERASDEIVRREREHSVSLAASLAERTRAEQALRGLFERNLAGIFRSRRDGRMLECNTAFVQILGYKSREELLAHNAKEWYVHPEDREHVLKLLQPGVVVTNHEMAWRRADGRQIWVLVNVREVMEAASTYLEGIVLDITDRRRRS
jgi:PAS domain S-box-containing protein